MENQASRALSANLTVAGAAATVVAVSVVVAGEQWVGLVPVALAFTWFLAGFVATRARPDHALARLLLAVGAAHLVAFALSAPVSLSTSTGWLPWAAAALGNLAFAAGFGALALVLALYPRGRAESRAERWLVVVTWVLVAAAAVLPAMSDPRLDLAVQADRTAVPAPSPLPLLPLTVDPFPLLLVLVVVGVALLVRRGRRAGSEERRALAWASGAGALLALLLVGTPAGVHVLGHTAWSLLFAAAAGAVPFALLAGLVRYRLLAVDAYVARTLAYGTLSVLAMSLYAGAAAVAGDRFPLVVPVAVAVVAAVTGDRLRRGLEALVDRFVTGGRVRRSTVVRDLTRSLTDGGHDAIAERSVAAVRDGLETAWARLVLPGRPAVAAGVDPGEPPAVTVPLSVGGTALGALECGPRHGGWSPPDVELLGLLGRHMALALSHARLTRTLEQQVEELTASRARLVQAEESVRRRLERDLHDGVQQQLVALLARLEVLRSLLPAQARETEVLVVAHELARRSLSDLREIARGIHPALLGDQGLVAAVRTQVALLPLPVSVDVDPRLDGARWAPEVESGAYFVVLEALTNVLRHSGAARAGIAIRPVGEDLVVVVRDQGCGFVGPTGGTGLAGLRDRVEALGGSLAVDSAAGAGTTVTARLPARTATRA